MPIEPRGLTYLEQFTSSASASSRLMLTFPVRPRARMEISEQRGHDSVLSSLIRRTHGSSDSAAARDAPPTDEEKPLPETARQKVDKRLLLRHSFVLPRYAHPCRRHRQRSHRKPRNKAPAPGNSSETCPARNGPGRRASSATLACSSSRPPRLRWRGLRPPLWMSRIMITRGTWGLLAARGRCC
ncbi:hypothetical protein LX36DRAFT_279560 [Colletotrichum falcatum]|nr:hypothetical protein LX36DRAFT_279560 [Colletotrichum falcatum]